VWCRDRLQARLAALNDGARAEVQHALGSAEIVARLATPSPKPVENIIGPLPLPPTPRLRTVDSWWRR
jgi:hypothetical protein